MYLILEDGRRISIYKDNDIARVELYDENGAYIKDKLYEPEELVDLLF